ncbi:type II secretion system protein [Candidatus Saccharibacteria bacterium]|nr:type II secretion system protein [Candidatus Saccharibacteria bacterium]
MAKQNINSKKGFTIIEVVLVLAIAGLIFLMVFVALPALQRSQRDTARRNDIARVDTSLTQYQTNHQTSPTTLPSAASWDPYDEANIANTNKGEIVCSNNEACRFVRDYMNSGASTTDGTAKKNEFKDPDGTFYGVVIAEQGDTTFSLNDLTSMDHMVYIQTGAKCNDDEAVKDTPRHYAVLYRLEGAGVYCIDDQ